jgi:hypothetical protein
VGKYGGIKNVWKRRKEFGMQNREKGERGQNKNKIGKNLAEGFGKTRRTGLRRKN